MKIFSSKVNRVLTIILALVMLLGMMPAAAAAYDDGDADSGTPAEVIDLTGSLYNDNIVSAEELEAILSSAEQAEAPGYEEDPLAEELEPGYPDGEEFELFSSFGIDSLDTGLELVVWRFTGANSFNANLFENQVLASAGTQDAARLQFLTLNNGVLTQRGLSWSTNAINVLNETGAGSSGLDGFANNAWWQTAISTEGLADVEVSWRMRSTSTGPRDWKLQYSTVGGTDPSNWSDAHAGIQIARDGTSNPAITFPANHFTLTLPTGADNQPTLYLRWLMTSNTAPNGNPIAPAGTHQIHDIVIIATGDAVEPTPVANRITSLDQIRDDGRYAIVSKFDGVYYAMNSTRSANVLTSTDVSAMIDDDLLVVDNEALNQNLGWTLTRVGDSFSISGNNIPFLAYGTSGTNFVFPTAAEGNFLWNIEDGKNNDDGTEGLFLIRNGAFNARIINLGAPLAGGVPTFRAYTFGNLGSSDTTNRYGEHLYLFELDVQDDDPIDPDPVITPIRDAHNISSGTVTIEGIAIGTVGVTGADAANLWVQDGSGPNDGILVFGGSGNDLTGHIGNRIRVTGTRTAFQTMNQLTNPTIEVIGLEELAPVPIQVEDLAPPSYRHMRVSIERVQVLSRAADAGAPAGTALVGVAGGPRIELRLLDNAALPDEIQNGDWIVIERAHVHWWNARNAVQLLQAVVHAAPPPAITGVTADPQSGALMPAGSSVTLSTTTEEGRIRYRFSGETLWLESDANSVNVVINEFNQPDNSAVIEAYAFLPGTAYQTDMVTFTYTQAKVADVVSSHVSGTLRPGTTIILETATAEAEIFYVVTLNVGADNEVVMDEEQYADGILLQQGVFPVRITAVARAKGFIESGVLELNFTERPIGGEQIYFGQLHAHSTMSDGQGTPEWAFEEARDIAGLDFFALTDHSNWFTFAPGAGTNDGPEVFNLRDYNSTGSYQWDRGNAAAAAASTPDFLAINAFEFTWSGGPGHINTFNTSGWVCRRNAYLNVNDNNLRLQRYYELLRQTPESVSMFNHPGTVFGNFLNFAHFDPTVAQRIPLLEVANGEGAIGAGGYFPTHDQYTLALDRGWLVAPANGQDNHRGSFGWSNEGRVAIYTNDFSHEGMWQAFRDRAAYSTEVRDMEIRYYVNDLPMGTVMHSVPDVAEFKATVYVPEIPRVTTIPRARDTYTITRISLITNGGIEHNVQQFDVPVGEVANYEVVINNPSSGYHYLRVVAVNSLGQERIALTAPVWLGRDAAVGITAVTTETFMPVTTEQLTLETTFFNDESFDVELISTIYVINGEQHAVFAHDGEVIKSNETMSVTFDYTPTTPGVHNVNVRAVIRVDGVYRYYDGFITLNVRDINEVGFIGIDASHFNEYVDGNYRDSFTNFAQVAANMNLVTVVFRTDAELIAAANNPRFEFLLIAAPGRHASIITDPARGEHRSYSDAVVEAVAGFATRGGTVAITGFGNFNDQGGRIPGIEGAHSFDQNRLLAAMGSNIRVGDASHSAPAGFRETANAHQHDLRYRNNFNLSNPFMQGVVPREADSAGIGQLYRNFSTGALYVVNDGNAIIRNADDVASFVVSGDVDLLGQFGVDPMVLSHPGSWTLDSNSSQGAGRAKFPAAGANFPRYAHPELGMIPAPPQGTGDGQRPSAGGSNPGQHLVAASQQVGEGTVLVFASMFFSNFDVRAELDFLGQLPNANLTISEHIFTSVKPDITITDIATVRAAQPGEWFTIEGIVTSGLQVTGEGSAENRGFMNSIYIQDATGGINLFEVTEGNAAGLAVGQTVRVRGFVGAYQGETQLNVHIGGSFQIIDTGITIVEPRDDLTIPQIASPDYTGWLVRTEGVVSDVIMQPGSENTVMQFTLTGADGSIIVYMRDYITPGVDLGFVEDGATVSVAGFASHGENASTEHLPRIRIRDRNEITLIAPPADLPCEDCGEYPCVCEPIAPPVFHTVRFWSWSGGTLLSEQNVQEGEDAVAPAIPARPGFSFNGWSAVFSNITGELEVYGLWLQSGVSGQVPGPPPAATPPQNNQAGTTVIDDDDTPLAEAPAIGYAQELFSLELFLGVGVDGDGDPIFALEQELTRLQALVLTIRLLGLEREALAFAGLNPFGDVPEWGVPYVAFAFEIGLTNGISAELFGSEQLVTTQQFTTFLLRALGYSDTQDRDFTFAQALDKAIEVELYTDELLAELSEGEFSRGDAVIAMVRALLTNVRDEVDAPDEEGEEDSPTMLIDTLVEAGLFSREDADIFVESIRRIDDATA